MNVDEVNEQEEQEEKDLYEHYKIKVDAGQEPLRVDKFLVNRLEKVSRTRVQNAIEAGSVLVNGNPVKSNYKVKPKDEVSIVLAEPPREFEVIAEDISLNIIYEDEDVVVIDKPAGLVVHPGYGNYTGTLVNALTFHFQNLPVSKEFNHRPGLVHRIDKDTSGLLVVAKNEFAMTFLAKQFFDRTITRSYLALVWGDVEQQEGFVENYIGRSMRNRQVMDVFPDEDYGKYAYTSYNVEERFGYVTLISCKLKTGRTHQIRIHMKSIGHPLFNDSTYGGDRIVKGTIYSKYKQFIDNCFQIMPRQALHARSLGFIHPSTKKEMYFEAELPEDFSAVLDKWRRYSSGFNL